MCWNECLISVFLYIEAADTEADLRFNQVIKVVGKELQKFKELGRPPTGNISRLSMIYNTIQQYYSSIKGGAEI